MATLAEEIRSLLADLAGDGSRPDLMNVATSQGGNPPAAPQEQPRRPPLISGARPRFGGGSRPETPSQRAFGAGLADPFGLPTAVIGLFNPEMRDRIRAVQAGGEPGMGQLGQMTSGMVGFGALPAMGAAGNMMAGAAAGSAPTMDYVSPNRPEGATLTNAMLGPAIGAAFPAGQAIGPALSPSMRMAVPATGALGAGAIGYGMVQAANEAEAQSQQRGAAPRRTTPGGASSVPSTGGAAAPAGQPPSNGFDARTLAIIDQNAELRALYAQLQEQQALAARPPDRSISGAERARSIQATERLRTELLKKLGEATSSSQPFAQAHPWLSTGLQIGQVAAPLLLGLATRRTNINAHNTTMAPWREAVDNAFAAAPGGSPAPAPTIMQRLRGVTPTPPAPNPAAFEVNAMRAIGNRDAWKEANNLPMWQTAAAGLGENAMVGASGGMLAMEASMYPHLYNLQRAEPGSTAHNQALQNFANARGQNGVNAMMSQWMPGAMGTLGATGMMHIPGRRTPAPVGDTNALEGMLKQQRPNVTPPPPPPPPRPTPYRGQAMTELRERVATALENLPPGGQLNPNTLLRGSTFANSRDTQITTAINNINGQLQAGSTGASLAGRVRSGGFMPLMGVAGASAAIAHHSATQPRGEDGRFVGDPQSP